MADGFVSLRGREHEPAVEALLAAAQIHRPVDERAARGPLVADEYAASADWELWGYEHDARLLAIAGVELRGAALELNELAVASDAQRNGLGRRMLTFLRDRYPHVAIEGNTIAESLGFYVACGLDTHAEGSLPSGEPVYRFSLPAGRSVA